VPVRIREYTAGAAGDTALEHYIKPTLDTRGYTVADLRRDWPSRLLRYREKIHGRVIQG